MKFIATEEHLPAPQYLTESDAWQNKTNADLAKIRTETALKLGEKRIAEMDAAGVEAHVLLFSQADLASRTGEVQVQFARELNNYLFEITKCFPGRFIGFTAVPVSDPVAAAKEISRTVTEYNFKGFEISGNIGGKYMDDPLFDPILKQAATLDVPIYLHPFPPSQDLFNILYAGNYSAEVAQRFSTPGWGWHIEVAVHLMRLILSGVFDRYPKLQIIVGHLGEALPYMMQRSEVRLPKSLTKLEREICEYLRENVYYTISGFCFLPPCLTMLMQVGAERIMYSVDYPHGDMAKVAEFVLNLPISARDKQRIAHENAERLLLKK